MSCPKIAARGNAPIAKSCGVLSGTYLSRSARLEACIPTHSEALACASSGTSRGVPSIVLLTSVRPEALVPTRALQGTSAPEAR